MRDTPNDVEVRSQPTFWVDIGGELFRTYLLPQNPHDAVEDVGVMSPHGGLQERFFIPPCSYSRRLIRTSTQILNIPEIVVGGNQRMIGSPGAEAR